MAADPVMDAALARRLLERAVAASAAPTLTTAEVDDLMGQAVSLDADGFAVYTGLDLNRAASTGWTWKAGKVSPQTTVDVADVVKVNREQVFQHCIKMAADYLLGIASVLGAPQGARRGRITSIRLTSDIAGGTYS